MSLLRRLERLEAHVQSQNQEEEFWVCRELIYDPRECEIGEDEEIISRMQTGELDRLVSVGEIREVDRERVRFIVNTIVRPTRPNDAAFLPPDTASFTAYTSTPGGAP